MNGWRIPPGRSWTIGPRVTEASDPLVLLRDPEMAPEMVHPSHWG